MMNYRILAVIVLLNIFVARYNARGEDQSSFEGPKVFKVKASMSGEPESKLTDFKAQTFVEGSDAILKCDSPKIQWNELIYIIWNISLQSKKCWLGIESSFQNSTCNDGKKLRNSSDGISLVIPKISIEDEGSYLCDVSYKGGSYGQKVNLSVHKILSWQEVNNGQKVAICQAKIENEKSRPTLQWEPALNISTNISYTSFIVENRVHLPDNVTISNLTCVITYPSKIAQQNLTNADMITIAICSFCCLILVSVAVGLKLYKKLQNLSALKTMCCKSKISTPAEEKPPQQPDVEEVEPYASYIQRVNSIYNSSAELFNA